MKNRIIKRAAMLGTTFLLIASSATWAAPKDALIIDDMETNRFEVPAEKVTLEAVAGHNGQAFKISFADESKSVFVRGRVRANADWDKTAGFSFWVKGDGSDHLGGLQFIWNNDYAVRYGYAFPISGTTWQKITVPWRDLIPELSAPILPLDAKSGNAPSKLGPISFGKWWYWNDYAAHSYAIDDIRLEPNIALDTQDYRPAALPLARVAAKLKAGQPITVVTMGDSLTDVRHWTNRQTNWPTTLQTLLKAQYGSETKIVNPAMGGTELRHNLVVMPRWTSVEAKPDLVTIFFGFNDYESGMRGPEFVKVVSDAIDRIRRATGGSADVLILTTVPSLEKGERLAELAEACRQAAAAKNAGIADINIAFSALQGDERARLYADDKVHLALSGQQLIAQIVLQSLQNGGR